MKIFISVLALFLCLCSSAAPAQTTHFIAIVGPTDTSGGDEMEADGTSYDVIVSGHTQTCTITPFHPTITLFGTTATGTVVGLTGTVQQISNSLTPDVEYKGVQLCEMAVFPTLQPRELDTGVTRHPA